MDIHHKQVGALPYRLTKSGDLEVLLVTSRGTGQWIIPKGWPIDGVSDPEAAAREAYEEAGLMGVVDGKQIGTFAYEKETKESEDLSPFIAEIYPMKVDRQLAFWPEFSQRRTTWLSIDLAIQTVTNASLAALLASAKPILEKAR